MRARVTAGEHLLSETYIKTYHGLPPSYNGPEPSKRPPEPLISARGKLTEKDIETLRKYGTRIKTDAIETRVDNRFESLDIGGPFNQGRLLRLRACARFSCADTLPGNTRMLVRRPSSPTSHAAHFAGR